jgi:hypothetical protein
MVHLYRVIMCIGVLCALASPGEAQAPAVPEADRFKTYPPVPAVATARMTYDSFLALARTLQPGAAREVIIAALGIPAEEDPGLMRYILTDLPGFPGMPPPVGVQVFPAFSIPMREQRMSAPIEWAWMDVIGMPPSQKRPARTPR